MAKHHGSGSNKHVGILILEESAADAELAVSELKRSIPDFEFKRIETRHEFVDEINSHLWDIILADYALPGFEAEEALKILKQLNSKIPLILMTDVQGEEAAVKCIENGAYDYILKSNLTRLPLVFLNAIRGKEIEAKYRRITAALEGASDLVATFEPDGKILYLNSGGRRLLKLSENEKVGDSNIADIYPDSVKESIVREALPAAVRGGFWSGETTLQQRDGSEVSVSQVIVAHKSTEDGIELVEFFSTIARDISSQKRNEYELREKERRYRELADSLSEAVFETAADGLITFANQKAVESFGYSREDFEKGMNFLQLFAPSEEGILAEKFRQRLRKAKASSDEYLALRKNGRTFPAMVYSTPIIHERKAVGLRGIVIDLSLQKEAQDRLREQAALIDIAPSAMFLIDMEGRITFWSKGAERVYKWKSPEVIGKKFSEFFDKKTATEIEAEMAFVMASGTWNGETNRVTKDGDEIVVEANWTLVRDNNGIPKSILISDINITEKKRLEEQYLRSQRMEGVGILVGGIAHDLNNVLAPILMAVELLKSRTADEKNLRVLTTLEESANRGADMVKQIFSFVRGSEEEKVPLNLKHVVNEVVSVIKQTFPKNVNISSSLANDLLPVMSDHGQLYQIMMNLCVNARDAMPLGGDLRISVRTMDVDKNLARMQAGAPSGKYTVVEVEDTGVGISPKIQPKIFEPFFTTKESDKKTGLGLSTVKNIIKSHGGFIDFVSKVGKGTKFVIYLPAVEGEELAKEDGAVKQLHKGNGETILVVDDELSMIEMTRNTLELYNYSVLTARDGSQAVAIYSDNKDKISAVVLDLMMPIMDGTATLAALRNVNPKLKAIIITGSNLQPGESLMLDANAFLRKPYSAEVILNVLSDVLKF
ncbi:MAG: PAS domain S-box protein [Bacteroidetes bacterium]|nr:PAS domain S-box protein [Bacteroidota bacterium]MCL5738399.1 PAS domain S-box protein [Bacteroidota bacterium]